MKSNNGGKSRSGLNLVAGSRKSSKNEWAHASRGLKLNKNRILANRTYVILVVGLYSSSFEQRAIASVDVRGRKTLLHGWDLISGNLNSFISFKKSGFYF